MAGHGTLHEVQTMWSIDDLMDCHEVLDLKEEIEEFHSSNIGK